MSLKWKSQASSSLLVKTVVIISNSRYIVPFAWRSVCWSNIFSFTKGLSYFWKTCFTQRYLSWSGSWVSIKIDIINSLSADLENTCHSLYQSNALCKVSFINHSSAFLQSNGSCKKLPRKNTGKQNSKKLIILECDFHYAVMNIHFLVVYSTNTCVNVLAVLWMCRTCVYMFVFS